MSEGIFFLPHTLPIFPEQFSRPNQDIVGAVLNLGWIFTNNVADAD